jgi:hypothetical protein
MGMERSEIAAGGTIKKGLHKTPTTEYLPQLFDARCHLSGFAISILHEIWGRSLKAGVKVDSRFG